jgi:hypothetical protein
MDVFISPTITVIPKAFSGFDLLPGTPGHYQQYVAFPQLSGEFWDWLFFLK